MTIQKSYGKQVLALGLAMLAAMLLVRVILISMGANAQGILGRVTESREALTQVVKEPNELVMVYGSSMTQAGFSPRQFDTELAKMGKDITSFNYGFGGLNPFFQDYLSRRIAEQFENNDRRLKLAMIEFNPFQTTSVRWNRAESVVDSMHSCIDDETLHEGEGKLF